MRPEVTLIPAPVARRGFLALGMAAFGAAMIAGAVAGVGPAAAGQDKAARVGYLKPQAAYDAAQKGEIILIDIRRPDEWAETNLGEGAIGLDMREKDFVPILVGLRRANPDKPIALICRTGARTAYVTQALAAQGFPGLVDVSEGMVGGKNGPGWLKRGLPTYVGSPDNVKKRREALLN